MESPFGPGGSARVYVLLSLCLLWLINTLVFGGGKSSEREVMNRKPLGLARVVVVGLSSV